MCRYPVPLDAATRKPERKGVLTWCPPSKDKNKNYACTTLVKDGSIPTKFGQDLVAFSSEAFDRAVAAETADILRNLHNLNARHGSAAVIQDPYGILVPISGTEPPIAAGDARYVSVPIDSINSIAASIPERLRVLYQENPQLAEKGTTSLVPALVNSMSFIERVEMYENGVTVGRLPISPPRDVLEITPPSTFMEPGMNVYRDSGELDLPVFRRGEPVENMPLLNSYALPQPQLVSTLPPTPQYSAQGFFSRVKSLFARLFGI